ncbi:hypothetical protein [Sphingopyxis sp. MWB1]|uniref:hypothetical protein n=1 Tax=Sphingopyxis sp. MWB1 TaxID=1537715 RepID=UPI000519FB1F|nr:hypothetical protein [Sphingopyxis sp. MWB1]
MKKLLTLACAVAALGLSAPVAAQEQPSDDILSQMFLWWNEAFKTPGAYTADNFSRFFTPDATLVLEGKTVINGVDQWATHFQRIQAGGGDVEIVVPFKQVFEQSERIYTYHVIRSRRDGQLGCSLAAGHAELDHGKISSIILVRSELDPAKGPLDPQCWTK